MKELKGKYILFDAKDKILGRFAVEVAKTLSGKNKVDFSPHLGGKDWAVVINSDKIRLSGEKASKKMYYRHSGYPGGIKEIVFKDLLKKDSRLIITQAVKGMLPKNKLSKEALKRLRVFKGEEHDYEKEITKSKN